MSFKSIFHLDDKEYNVLQCNYDFHQNSDVNGRPSGKPFLTSVSILLEVKDITMFLLWATHPTMQKHFILEYLPRIVGTKGRKIYGFDVNCVKYEEVFNANSNTPHTVRLELTCGGFEEGNAKYSTTWRKTISNKVPVTTINYNEEKEEEQEEIIEEKKDKKCIIKFEADSRDIKNGIFGFDKIPKNYKKICKSDITKLEKEYLSLTVEGEKYIPAWVSMRKGQTITLKLDKNIKQKAEYESIAFEEHPDFTITPTDLKDAKEIQITCNNTNQNTAQIKVIADGKDAGAINFFYPKPKTIDLKWYFVEITGKQKDKNALENKISQSKLKTLLKKGLNPALIDVTLSNTTAEIVDVSEKREDLITRKYLKTFKIDETTTIKYLEQGEKSKKVQKFFNLLNGFHSKEDTNINLYCINRKCIKEANLTKGNSSYPMAGGLSPIGTGLAYMTLDDGDKIQAENIIHEIMHALGLHHSFSTKATHTFKQAKTKNYMDYDNTKRLTYKWQWTNLHTYSHLK